MKQPRHEIAVAIAERTLGVSDVKRLADEVAAYLMSIRRTNEFESLMRDVMQIRADRGLVEVVAVSAFPLGDTVRADIRAEVQKLHPSATQIIMSHRLDSTVVSGVRLEFPNQQLDLSVRNKLNKLKQLTAAS